MEHAPDPHARVRSPTRLRLESFGICGSGGIVGHRLCGCGKPLLSAVWSRILSRTFDGFGAVDVDGAIEAVNWLGDASNLPSHPARGKRGTSRTRELRQCSPALTARFPK